MAEQRSPKPQVGGSIPSWPAIHKDITTHIIMGDNIKLGMSLIIAITAVAGFYIYAEQSLLLRVVGLLGAVAIAAAIAVQTEAGRGVWSFGRGATVEIRKVVWPSRKETVQTTLMVMIMVVIVGIILWIFDWFVSWGVGYLTGQGG